MAVVAQGSISDRPFGRTFYALALRQFHGELTLEAQGKHYVVGWSEGAVVSAHSPLPGDALVRIALTHQLLNSSQVNDVMTLTAASGDEVLAVSKVARLDQDKLDRLLRRATAQRAMRLFAVEQGTFVLDSAPKLPAIAHPIDARALIFNGVYSYFSDRRLLAELATLGMAFQLVPEAAPHLAQYGFAEVAEVAERGISEPLRPDELEQHFPQFEPKRLRAMLYALAVTGAAQASGGVAIPRTMTPPPGVAAEAPRLSRTATPMPASVPPTATGSVAAPQVSRTATGIGPRRAAPPLSVAARDEIVDLIRHTAASLDLKADHFMLLGLERTASANQVRETYFEMARKLHPDRLTALELGDEMKVAHKVFAAINAAFAVLSHPKRRADYEAILDAGGQEAVDEKEVAATEQAMKMLDAEAAYQRGEMALRRNNYQAALGEFRTAVELNPDEADHQTMFGWALWVASTDKASVKKEAMAALDRGIEKAPKSPLPHLYLGRIARTSGQDADAVRHFEEAIKRSPGHTEATAELRVLQSRMSEPKPTEPKPKGGLFSKLRGG